MQLLFRYNAVDMALPALFFIHGQHLRVANETNYYIVRCRAFQRDKHTKQNT